MKVLLGVVLAGEQKDYCISKFNEQTEKVFDDVDVIFAVDERNESTQVLCDYKIRVPEMDNTHWATEMVYHGKRALTDQVLASDYDALIWQGIDCFYDTKEDFEKLIDTGERKNAQIIGALVAGRNRPDYPVCRAFKFDTPSQEWTKQEQEMPRTLLDGRRPTPVPGYIGSDATLVKKWMLETVTFEGYQHWHERITTHPEDTIGPEQWFMWEAIARYHSIPLCHTGIRPWHAHETGRTVRYPGEECTIDDLSWEGAGVSS